MSRCFPYGPTLCARNVAGGEALIKMIKNSVLKSLFWCIKKLHCEKDKSKTESLKEKKRESKKKRKEKDVKPNGFSDGKVKKLNNEKCRQEEKNRALLGEYLSKKSEDEEAERLEKSSLTDEHNEPVCYLSDGTQSSNKRKRQPSPSTTTSTTPSITVHKNILRIRLPSLKHRESDPSLRRGQSCPTVGRTANSLVQQESDKEQCRIRNKVEEASPISDSSRNDSIAQFDANTGNGMTLNEKKVTGTESFYKALVEDWVPSSFQSVLNDRDDEDWLFGTKWQSHEFKRLKAGNDVPCRQISTLWPCAHRMPEADIYALPYSIPF